MLVTRPSRLVTFSLVAYNWEPLTASVLVLLSSPAATLVILFTLTEPWLALKAPSLLSHNKASCISPLILLILLLTSSLVAFNCEPFTASVLLALRAPSATLVILLEPFPI
ncbi:hypothetical protein D3C80_1402480 [compost metagenome]